MNYSRRHNRPSIAPINNQSQIDSTLPFEIIKYNDVFRDVEEWIRNTYSESLNGCTLILGYNVMNVESIKRTHHNRKIIVYQLEQLFPGSIWASRHILDQMKYADEIWEYDENNIPSYAYLGKTPKIIRPGYHPSLNRIPKTIEKTIDVLFYGNASYPRRSKAFEALKTIPNLQLCIAPECYGLTLDELISKSKIILNAHSFEESRQEQVRIFYPLANSKCILSEKSPINHYGDMIVEWDGYNDLIQKTIELLENDNYKKIEEKTIAFQIQK